MKDKKHCFLHPEREAVAECSVCGKPLCEECAIYEDDGKVYCSTHAAKKLVLDYTLARPTHEEEPRKKPVIGRPVIRRIVIMMSLALVVGIAEYTTYISLREPAYPSACAANIGSTDSKLQLAMVGTSIERYQIMHGNYPPDIIAVIEEHLLPDEFRFPAVHGGLVYHRSKGGFTLTSPVAPNLVFTEKGLIRSEKGETR
ncbi:MAG: hypothetical protein B6D65_00300 [candidate division Zixibacteria bacterium 4484_93]|nr:MAG: hypothetical protein B6D65_00300 [candidate division Zixibacteria bacterium 4484_93]